MSTKRDRRRSLLLDQRPALAPPESKLIRFGSPRHPADRCTYADAPAVFAVCLDCSYNHGAHGSGISCSHRFGIDPTLVDGVPTQLDGDGIRWLDGESLTYQEPPV